jgi:small subunit ribosomal protein S3Ae
MAGKKKTKVVDKWKTKKWYTVVAPPVFEGRQLCEVVSSDEKNLTNRIIKRSLMDLGLQATSQMAMFTNLQFRITDVKGNTANTIMVGHEILPSYLKTFARRGKSLIHQIVDVKTKDGQDVRIKIIAVTGSKVSENTRRNIRKIIVDETVRIAKETNYDELSQDLIYGRFSSKIFNKLKEITKMRRVEVRKSERKEVFA